MTFFASGATVRCRSNGRLWPPTKMSSSNQPDGHENSRESHTKPGERRRTLTRTHTHSAHAQTPTRNVNSDGRAKRAPAAQHLQQHCNAPRTHTHTHTHTSTHKHTDKHAHGQTRTRTRTRTGDRPADEGRHRLECMCKVLENCRERTRIVNTRTHAAGTAPRKALTTDGRQL